MKLLDRIARIGAQVLDPDVQAFAAYIGSVGSSVNYGSLQAVSTAVKQMKGAGLWTSLRVWAPMVGNDLGAARVQFLITSAGAVTFSQATNVNFVAGDWVESSGLTGNATNKYLNTGVLVPAPLGGLGVVSKTTWSAASVASYAMGAANPGGGNYFMVAATPSDYRYYYGQGTTVTIAGLAPAGVSSISRISTTRLVLNVNGQTVWVVTTSANPSQIAWNAFVFSVNNNGTILTPPTTFTCQGYWIQEAMAEAHVVSLHAILNELQQRVRLS